MLNEEEQRLGNQDQTHYVLPDGWNPKQAVDMFMIPDEFQAAELPKPSSKHRSPLYDYGVKVFRKDTGHQYWFCCASRACFQSGVIISIRKSTSMATQHLQVAHGLAPFEKRNKKHSDAMSMFGVSKCDIIFIVWYVSIVCIVYSNELGTTRSPSYAFTNGRDGSRI